MAKQKKKNVKDIQAALLSNTSFLNKDEAEETIESVEKDLINHEVLEKFEILANYEKTEASALINKALNHYLKLKGLQFEQALKAKNSK